MDWAEGFSGAPRVLSPGFETFADAFPLHSAPPVYDGGVADYIASLPVAPRSGRPSFEDEALPGY